ncbi:MAG: serine/threonine-protein kinase [Polyangiaceae bacterium]
MGPPSSGASAPTLDLGWGRVVIGALIGDGGMGRVYRGWLYYNPAGPRAGARPHEVAVKVLHPTFVARPEIRKLFLGEAEALAKLSHPNIVQFFGLADTGRQLALVIELVEGEALDIVIERHVRRATPGGLPCLPFARAWHYFQQLLGSLAATHALGIVHRDVKPGNLLIRTDGLAKLTDFGIARLPTDQPSDSLAMQPGTGAYMSPEQVLGHPLDGRSDLYSAAIVLYEMIVGITPFEKPELSEIQIRTLQVEGSVPPVTQRVPFAPPIIDALFARALAKNRDQRFANAIELGNAFRSALNLPDTLGWQAQQNFAAHAQAIAGTAPRGRGSTVKMEAYQVDQMRNAVAGAYRG